MPIMMQAPAINDIELSLILNNRGWNGNIVTEATDNGIIFGFLTDESEMIVTATYDHRTDQRIISYLAEEEEN